MDTQHVSPDCFQEEKYIRIKNGSTDTLNLYNGLERGHTYQQQDKDASPLLQVNETRLELERRTSLTDTRDCKVPSQLPGFIVISIH